MRCIFFIGGGRSWGGRVLPKKREIEDSRMDQGKMPGEDVVSA